MAHYDGHVEAAREQYIAQLEAKVRELEERLNAYDGGLLHDELVAHAQKIEQLEREKVDLEAKLRQVEEERDQARRDRQDMIWERDTLLTESGILRARVGELEAALRASRIGLDDWLNQYASELCDEERVQEAVKRIEYHGGTLSYIARLQDKNKRALEGKEEHGTRRDE